MKKTLLLFVAFVMTVAFCQVAQADEDPFFNEFVGNSCPTNCAFSVLANDPLWVGGPATVEYVLKNSGPGAIPTVVAGDVLIKEFGTNTIGDIIRFENISGSAVAFIYSDDSGLDADVGLPPFFQPVTLTLSEGSNGQAIFTPTSGQPGFCPGCAGAITYGLGSPDVPEPSSLLLFGTGLAALAGSVHRRMRK